MGRVRAPRARNEGPPKRALRDNGQLVFGGLAVNQEFRSPGILGSRESASAVSFFADDEEQREVARSFFQQLAYREDHRSDNAFGVARTTAPDVSIVLSRREERRNRVHVGGNPHQRIPPTSHYLEPVQLPFNALAL